MNDLKAGVILWFIDHDKVVYVPIETVIKYAEEEKKSINIKDLDSEYVIIDLPSQKKRTFMETDYSVLGEL